MRNKNLHHVHFLFDMNLHHVHISAIQTNPTAPRARQERTQMSNEKAFQIGQYAAFQGKPRNCPSYMEGESRRAWFAGYDALMTRAAA